MTNVDVDFNMVSVTFTVPSALSDLIDEKCEALDISRTRYMMSIAADAESYDLTPYDEAKLAERNARKAVTANKKAVTAKLASLDSSALEKLLALLEKEVA